MNRGTEADWEKFAKVFRKDLAIKRIKEQPFFRPRAPHPYEGAQWAIDMACGEDRTVAFGFNRVDGVIWIDPKSIRQGDFAPDFFRTYHKARAIERIKAQPFYYSPRRRWTAEEIAEYERGHKERTRKALERIEARRGWRA